MNGFDEFDIVDVLVAIFITAIFIGIVWAINDALGAFIPTSVWLLIVGVLGIVALYVFFKVRG